jgi:DNA-binding transcriptional ArsR family regulator
MWCRSSHSQLPVNPVRSAALNWIAQCPGIPFMELLSRLRSEPAHAKLGHGNLGWHLYRLQRAGLIASHRWGRSRHYFPPRWPGLAAFSAQLVLKRPRLEALALQILAMPGARRSDLQAATLGSKPALIRGDLRRLQRADLVTVVKTGKYNQYHPTSRLQAVLLGFSGPSKPSQTPQAALGPPRESPPLIASA